MGPVFHRSRESPAGFSSSGAAREGAGCLSIWALCVLDGGKAMAFRVAGLLLPKGPGPDGDSIIACAAATSAATSLGADAGWPGRGTVCGPRVTGTDAWGFL